jgi:hypothetical protein
LMIGRGSPVNLLSGIAAALLLATGAVSGDDDIHRLRVAGVWAALITRALVRRLTSLAFP